MRFFITSNLRELITSFKKNPIKKVKDFSALKQKTSNIIQRYSIRFI